MAIYKTQCYTSYMAKRVSPEKVTEDDRVVTRRVIEAREKSGLLKKELGKRLGLSESGYSPYENYKTAFTLGMLHEVARILGRPIGYFLGLDTGLTDDEGELLALYRAADTSMRGLILRLVRELKLEK